MELASLRKHWLLILLIVVGLLWWRIVDTLTPSELRVDLYTQSIDYWSIVVNPIFQQMATLVTIGIAIVTVLWILRFSKIRIVYRLLLLLVTLTICAASILSGFNLTIESGSNRTIKHVISVDYQGKTYHLAFSYYFTMDFGEYLPRYHVFKCDALGYICLQIYTKDTDFDSQPSLVVDGDRLILVSPGEQDQILPTVN